MLQKKIILQKVDLDITIDKAAFQKAVDEVAAKGGSYATGKIMLSIFLLKQKAM